MLLNIGSHQVNVQTFKTGKKQKIEIFERLVTPVLANGCGSLEIKDDI